VPYFQVFVSIFLLLLFCEIVVLLFVVKDLPVKNREKKFLILKRIVILTGGGREESRTEFFRLVP
jgi:hypothetical protein